MSQNRERASEESFLDKLNKLRLKIDLLPARQQPHMRALADVIEQQHRQLKNHAHQDDIAG
jgi:hypothetical protein